MKTESGLGLGLMPAIIATVAILYFARDVFIPLAVALLLAFVLAPAVSWLERWRVGHVASVLIAVSLALAVVTTIGWVVQQQLVETAKKLPDYQENIRNKFRKLQDSVGGNFSKAAKGVEQTLKNIAGTGPTTEPATRQAEAVPIPAHDWQRDEPTTRVSPQNPLPVRVYATPSSPLQVIGPFLGRLLSPLATTGLIIIFLIFMLLDRRDLRDRLFRLIGDGRLNVTTQALDDAALRISRYLFMQTVVNVTYGIPIAIGLHFIGIPDPILWGLLAFLLRYVPYVGPWIAAAAPVLLSLAVFDDMHHFLLTVMLYVVIELISNNVIEPWLYGSSSGLSAMAILVSAVFWTWLWGPIGLLLATPLTVCVAVIGKYVPQLRFLAILLGDEPVLDPGVRLYQRLLSLDQDEASELLHAYRKEKGLACVYDEVLIPALAMVEQNRHAGQLDDQRGTFVLQAVRDLVEELGDAQKVDDALPERVEVEEAPKSGSAARRSTTNEPQLNVLCLPARDEADEIVGLMLAQLLSLKGLKAVAVSQAALAGEMLDWVQEHRAGAVCVSAVPPAALAHARYLCKRLQTRFRDLPTVVGLWASKADPNTSLDRLACKGTVRLVARVGAAVAEIQQLIEPLKLQRSAEAEKSTRAHAVTSAGG